jgi:hypothetical protein
MTTVPPARASLPEPRDGGIEDLRRHPRQPTRRDARLGHGSPRPVVGGTVACGLIGGPVARGRIRGLVGGRVAGGRPCRPPVGRSRSRSSDSTRAACSVTGSGRKRSSGWCAGVPGCASRPAAAGSPREPLLDLVGGRHPVTPGAPRVAADEPRVEGRVVDRRDLVVGRDVDLGDRHEREPRVGDLGLDEVGERRSDLLVDLGLRLRATARAPPCGRYRWAGGRPRSLAAAARRRHRGVGELGDPRTSTRGSRSITARPVEDPVDAGRGRRGDGDAEHARCQRSWTDLGDGDPSSRQRRLGPVEQRALALEAVDAGQVQVHPGDP